MNSIIELTMLNVDDKMEEEERTPDGRIQIEMETLHDGTHMKTAKCKQFGLSSAFFEVRLHKNGSRIQQDALDVRTFISHFHVINDHTRTNTALGRGNFQEQRGH